MNITPKKTAYFIVILIICSFFMIYLYSIDKQDISEGEPYKNDGEGVGLQINYQAGDVLYDNELLEVSEGSVALSVWLDHQMKEAEEYGLIILQDFIQTPFFIDNINIDNIFVFNAEPYSENILLIDIPISNETSELVVIIVKKPNDIMEDFQIETALNLEQVYVKRYIIKDQPITNKKSTFPITEPNKIIKDELNPDLFIGSNTDDLTPFSTIKEDTNFYMHVGNNLISQESLDYVIVGFKDWIQYPFINNNKTLYIPENSSGERKVFELLTPSVEKQENIQFIAFPYPYEIWNEQFYVKAQGSFRIVVNPSH